MAGPERDSVRWQSEGEDGAPVARRFDPALKRNLLIIGGAVAVAVLLLIAVLLRAGSAAAQNAERSEISLGGGPVQRVEQMTPAMQANLLRKQTEEALQAQRTGQTYIPPDPVSGVQPLPAPATAPARVPSALQLAAAPSAQPAAGPPSAQTMEGLERQLRGLLEEQGDGAVRQRIVAPANGEARAPRNGPAPGVAQAPDPAAHPAAAESRKPVLPALTIAPAELTSDIRVPAGSQTFASARITAGPAAGAFLVGTAKVLDEALEISFTQMRLGESAYRVDAIVLDETTASAAIEGNVDRRILQRYLFPVALAMAQGFFAAKSQTGSTVVAIGAGGSAFPAITTPPPSSEQARSAGIASGLDLASQEAQKSAQQPIVVARGRSHPVGVLFRAPVTQEAR